MAMPDNSGSGSEGSQVSPRLTVTKRDNSKPARSSWQMRTLLWWWRRTDATGQLDHGRQHGATMERLSAFLDSNSPSVDFDGQVPREKTIDLHNHVLRGDWCSAGHVTKTCARICMTWSCCPMASPCSKGLVSRWRECRVNYAKDFSFSATVSVEVSLGTKLAQAEGSVGMHVDLTLLHSCTLFLSSQSCCVHLITLPTHSLWL